MNFQELDTVVLDRDLPEHSLRRGDLGAVVHVYKPDGLEVEFVTASGRTQALVTLKVEDLAPRMAFTASHLEGCCTLSSHALELTGVSAAGSSGRACASSSARGR